MAMEENELGLPLEYQELPEYFDAHNIGDDTEAKNRIIEKILHEHKVETVLDLTCGTGSQVFHLKKRGYKVIGADFSQALLDVARKKARKEKIDVRFIDGDMRTLKVGHFDAVITIFNAVGHLTNSHGEYTWELKRWGNLCVRHLQPGGHDRFRRQRFCHECAEYG